MRIRRRLVVVVGEVVVISEIFAGDFVDVGAVVIARGVVVALAGGEGVAAGKEEQKNEGIAEHSKEH
jgi:hypothetical protein